MAETTTFRCSRCGDHLPGDAFAPSHRKNGGWCRSCRKEYMQARYVPHPRQRRPSPPRICIECGVQVGRGQRLCSEECRRQRRNRRKTVTHPVGTLLALGQRDGTGCRICGEPLALDEVWPHPLSPSVDHIVARSRGGDERLSNLQLTHLGCNWRKFNRDAE